LMPCDISGYSRMDDVIKTLARIPYGATDCAAPMMYALDNKLEVDAFIVYTDNETWAGSIHPCQALVKYRKATGINAKLIVVGMTATGFTIADPSDAGMLDVIGFDSSCPAVMADFTR
jgi:60 kDa SS-A/Ro ribonucleoprotein